MPGDDEDEWPPVLPHDGKPRHQVGLSCRIAGGLEIEAKVQMMEKNTAYSSTVREFSQKYFPNTKCIKIVSWYRSPEVARMKKSQFAEARLTAATGWRLNLPSLLGS
jgi:hypothetical protein